MREGVGKWLKMGVPEKAMECLARVLGHMDPTDLRRRDLEARTAAELLVLTPPEIDSIMYMVGFVEECSVCRTARKCREKPLTPETAAVEVSGFRPRVASCRSCPHLPRRYTSWRFVSSVVESLMDAQIIRPLDAHELNNICGWMFYLYARRGMRDRFLDTGEDVVDVLDQLYFYFPDHMEDIVNTLAPDRSQRRTGSG